MEGRKKVRRSRREKYATRGRKEEGKRERGGGREGGREEREEGGRKERREGGRLHDLKQVLLTLLSSGGLMTTWHPLWQKWLPQESCLPHWRPQEYSCTEKHGCCVTWRRRRRRREGEGGRRSSSA